MGGSFCLKSVLATMVPFQLVLVTLKNEELQASADRTTQVPYLAVHHTDSAGLLPGMGPLHGALPAHFLYGQILRPLVYYTILRGTEKVTSTIWDAVFLSSLYPKFKRYVQTYAEPDSYYMAHDAVPTTERVGDLILNQATDIQVRTFLSSLAEAAAAGENLPSMIISGPPGTGKSALVKRMAAEGEYEIKMFTGGSLNALGTKELEHLFRWANTPQSRGIKILFIDEAETFLRSGIGQRSPQLQVFLEARGTGSPNYTVIAATNFPEQIDDAALRRFTWPVEMDLPDAVSRPKMFRYYLDRARTRSGLTFEGEFLSDPSSVEALLKQSEGLSGADIENICQNAAGESKYYGHNVLNFATLQKHIADNVRSNSRLVNKRVEASKKHKEEVLLRYYETATPSHPAPAVETAGS